MDLTSKRTIRDLLRRYNTKSSKGLGQNFLIDKTTLQKIIKTAGLQPEDIVLEVGPGIGALTQELAKRAKKIIAVEKDSKMCEVLKETLRDFKNIKIIQGNALEIGNWESTFREVCFASKEIGNYKVVANLPYYITSPIIRLFLEKVDARPLLMVLMVQKEVAQRICAKPLHLRRSVAKAMERRRQGYGGQAKMNLLAVSVQFYAKPEIISYISKKSFFPEPKVDSAIIQIIPRSSAYGSAAFREQFFRIVKAGFSQPRKQLVNNFSKRLALSLPKGLKLNKIEITAWLLKNNIQPTQRAETLTINDWLKLTKSIY